MNHNCCAEFPIKLIEKRRKCPKCKMDNHHCFKKIEEYKP